MCGLFKKTEQIRDVKNEMAFHNTVKGACAGLPRNMQWNVQYMNDIYESSSNEEESALYRCTSQDQGLFLIFQLKCMFHAMDRVMKS